MTNTVFRVLILVACAFASSASNAGPGHDHGDETPATSATVAPRVEAASDLFEVVGIVDGPTMTVFLDRAASNEPIADAALDVETIVDGQSVKLTAQPQSDGTYLVRADFLNRPGQYAFTIGVTAGGEVDVLAGNLELGAAAAPAAPARQWWAWLLVAAAMLVLAMLALARRRSGRRTHAAFVAAMLALTLSAVVAPSAHAGPGHDHGDTPATPTSNSPRRLPDGHVFLPKPSQRQLQVRTIVAEAAELPRVVTLMGRVVMDPNAGGKVQPTVAGRIEPGPKGLPHLGQRVRRGEVLALVQASAGSIERANQNATIAELQVARDTAERRLARVRQLEGSVSQREIDQAQADFDIAQRRLAAVTARAATVEPLIAPVSGIIAAANVVAGQVVDAREVAFQIVNPERMRIEAVAFDPTLAAGIGGASAAPQSPQSRGESISLKLVGAGRAQVEGGYPIQFATTGPDVPPLTVGQPMRVFVQSAARTKGIPVPAGAVVKSPSNEDIVWVKESAELFAPRPIRFEPVDGATVVVTAGLKPGERVVVQAAPLVNQVR